MYGKTFSHTDLMKQPCLAVKACQEHKYLIVLYIEKLLKHNINRMRGLIKGRHVFIFSDYVCAKWIGNNELSFRLMV